MHFDFLALPPQRGGGGHLVYPLRGRGIKGVGRVLIMSFCLAPFLIMSFRPSRYAARGEISLYYNAVEISRQARNDI